MRAWLLAALLLAPAALSAPELQLSVVWDVLPNVPVARTEVAAASVGGKVYVLGGLTSGGGSRRVDIFDPSSSTWSQGPLLPVALHHTQAVALGSRLIVIGGYTGSTFTPTDLTFILDTALPPQLRLWVPFVPLPLPRGAHAAATDGSRVWVFGGVGPGGLESTALKMEGLLGVPVPVWLPIADFPSPREHLAGAYSEGKVYAAGGRVGGLGGNTARLDAYDPATDAWTRGPNMPTPRGGIAAAAVAGHVFVYGGEGPSGTFSNAEAYDPASNTWTAVTPMPHARHGLGAAVVGDAVYVEAGGPVPGLTVSGHNERMRVA